MGQAIGCGAHLASLRRINSGGFGVDAASPLDVLLSQTPAEVKPKIVPFAKLVAA
jgi:tRNA U55 pseudouridine synthase TruB